MVEGAETLEPAGNIELDQVRRSMETTNDVNMMANIASFADQRIAEGRDREQWEALKADAVQRAVAIRAETTADKKRVRAAHSARLKEIRGRIAAAYESADVAALMETARDAGEMADISETAGHKQLLWKLREEASAKAEGVNNAIQFAQAQAQAQAEAQAEAQAPPVAAPVAVAPVPLADEPDVQQPITISISVVDDNDTIHPAPAVQMASIEAQAEDRTAAAAAKPKRKPKEPSAVSCAPENITNTIEGLAVELKLQEEELDKVQASTGSKGGVSKLERLELAQKAVSRVQRRIRSEEKKLGVACPITGTKRGPSVYAQAGKREAQGNGSKRSGTHPAVKLRNAVRAAQRRKSGARG